MTIEAMPPEGAVPSDVPVLEVEDLSVTFARRGEQPTRAVDGVSFSVAAGETIGLVGESGCGKSVTSLAIMGLLPRRGVQVGGSVRLGGTELLGAPDRTLRRLRGSEMAMVFQDPLSSLNPTVPIGTQVTEVLIEHRDMGRRRPGRRPPSCSTGSASPTRSADSRSTRTSCRAACGSGR